MVHAFISIVQYIYDLICVFGTVWQAGTWELYFVCVFVILTLDVNKVLVRTYCRVIFKRQNTEMVTE